MDIVALDVQYVVIVEHVSLENHISLDLQHKRPHDVLDLTHHGLATLRHPGRELAHVDPLPSNIKAECESYPILFLSILTVGQYASNPSTTIQESRHLLSLQVFH